MLAVEVRLTLQEHLDVLSVGDRVEELLGYKASDFLASPSLLEQLIHPSDLARMRGLFEPATSKHEHEECVRIRGIDGRMRCLSFDSTREGTSHGATVLRLTLSEAASLGHEGAVPASSIDLLAVLDGIDQCACIKDLRHVIRRANGNFKTVFAGKQHDATGLTDYDLFSEEFADRSYEAEEQVLGGSSIVHFAHRAADAQNRERSFESCVFPVRDEHGRTVGSCNVVIDTTTQTRAEHALRLSEETVKEAHRIAGLGSFVIDVPAQTWSGSEIFFEILGLDDDCPRTTSVWSDLILAEDLSGLGRIYGEMVMGSSRKLDSEARFIRYNDKAERWARIRCELNRDAQGQPRTLRGTIEDITERKRAEAQIGASANLLELFIQDAPTGLAMFDREMRYVSASRRWIEDRGLKEWDVVGRRLYELHAKTPESWKDDHLRAMAGELVPFREDCYEHEDGTMRWARRMVRPWRAGDGAVGGIVVLSEDITARKEAERALRASEESLKEAQRIAGVGSYVFDIHGGVWTSSEALDEIFGIDHADSHTVDDWKSLIHADDRAMMSAYLANEVMGKRAAFDKEYRIVRSSDQSVRWVQGRGRVEADADGNPVILRGTIQDITERKAVEASLMQNRRFLQLFIEHAPVAIAMFDLDMRYLAVSSRWIETYALEGQQILGKSHYEVFPGLPDHWKEAHRKGMNGEGVRMEEELFVRADGREHWVRWELLPWHKSDGAVGGIILFTEDITAIKRNAERLQLAASVFTHTSESIVITDANGAILDANEAFTRIYGYGRDEVLGQNPRLLNAGRQSHEFYAQMWAQLAKSGQWSGEIWNRAKSGQILPGVLTISAVPDAAGKTKQYVGLFSDLSTIKERERQLKQVAHFDVLTGLPNRALLSDRLRQAMLHARRMGQVLVLAYLDLDNFSAINQRHGRKVGDQLLNVLTQRMHTVLREADTLARLGGDEFAAVLLDMANVDEGLSLVGRLREIVGDPIQLDDLKLQVSVSIGVTFYPQADEVEPDQLVRQADQAMYFAKLAGKGRLHVFDPMLDRSMRGRHEDLQRIREALQAEEFELYFQPKVNMSTGAILGAEGLIRWRHPELGVLSPEHFLPVVEGNQLVIELGEWVIESALTHLEKWRDQGLDIPVSVNVDALQLQDPRFVDRLTESLARHPTIEPARLELEVLESSAFQDIGQVSEVLRACSKLGVSFALDDFGTGYSSLSYLKRLPVDVLKIDQSFVHDMLDDPEDLSILEGVLVLANAFRRRTIAEGVETVDHGLMLLRLGCPIGQGYQIARPMRGSDLPAWAASWRPDPRWRNVPAIDPIKWPILHATVEHRAWTKELEEFVQGQRSAAPPIDPRECRLGSWLAAEILAGRNESSSLYDLDTLHRRFHAHVDELLALEASDAKAPDPLSFDELRSLRDDLLQKLQSVLLEP